MNVDQVSYQHPDAKKQFSHSLKSTGFAVLTHHPISEKLISNMYLEWQSFFQDQAHKTKYLYSEETQSGYFPFRIETAKGKSEADLKEFFHYYPNDLLPAVVSTHTPTLRKELELLAQELLAWIEETLPPFIRKHLSSPLSKMVEGSPSTLFRVIHYPPLTGQEAATAVRADEHEDINLITLLPAATQPGLQVKDLQGAWHNVVCDPGMMVVNVGDMLQEATGGYLPSTTHRVVNPDDSSNTSRFSAPLFLHPHPYVKLSERYTAESYLKERLKELGLM